MGNSSAILCGNSKLGAWLVLGVLMLWAPVMMSEVTEMARPLSTWSSMLDFFT